MYREDVSEMSILTSVGDREECGSVYTYIRLKERVREVGNGYQGNCTVTG